MRDDTVKKFTEKPRRGKDTSRFRAERHRNNNPKDYDVLPKMESTKSVHVRHWGGSESQWSPKPLEGFLLKNLGRPWNKVYSEIRAQVSKNSKAEQDILHWLKGTVEVAPIWVGKVPHYSQVWSSGTLHQLRKGDLYVDTHGILRISKYDPPKKWYESRAPRKAINEYEEYRQLSEGIWFWVRYINLHPGMTGYDVILNKKFYMQPGEYWSCDELRRSNAYPDLTWSSYSVWRAGNVRLAVEKRQCSKKTIHDEKLNTL